MPNTNQAAKFIMMNGRRFLQLCRGYALEPAQVGFFLEILFRQGMGAPHEDDVESLASAMNSDPTTARQIIDKLIVCCLCARREGKLVTPFFHELVRPFDEEAT